MPENRFLPAEQAFMLRVDSGTDGQTLLHWDIAPGYYLYRQRLEFTGLPAENQPQLPTGIPHEDDYFGATEIYRDYLDLTLPAGIQGPFKVQWQGCADAGLCYPPQTLNIGASGANPAAPQAVADDLALLDRLQQQALWLNVLVFFGLGLLLAFTPCSLPMLPILAGIVVGRNASARRGFMLAATYVVSMAMVYALLGVTAAMLGANLQSFLQQPWLIAAFASLFVLLALPMFGFFELQLPVAVRDRLERAGQAPQGGSMLGAGLLGMLSGLLAGPCMTAPLAAALLFIAQSGSMIQGGLVLFMLGLGIGTPLLLLVTVGNRFLPKPGAWMNRVKAVFGYLLLATALYLLRPLLAEATWLLLAGAWLILAASGMLHLASPMPAGRIASRTAAALLGVWGAAMVLGAAAGGTDPIRPLEVFSGSQPTFEFRRTAGQFTDVRTRDVLQAELNQARAAKQWVLVDYYADWCVSCKVMEREVFGNAQVQDRLLSANVRKLRLDVTASGSESQALLTHYQVPGPPTVLLVGPDGKERRQWRMTGEVNAQRFLEVWESATQEQN